MLARSDTDRITQFFTVMFGEALGNQGLLAVSRRNGTGLSTSFATAADEACATVTAAPDQDWYFGCGLLRERPSSGRGTADDVRTIPGLWLDVDFGGGHSKAVPPDETTATRLLVETGLPPSLVVNSGHGLHVYWLFNQPWIFANDQEHDAAATLMEHFQQHVRDIFREQGYELDFTHDLARILRVPGTLNCKTEGQVPVTLVNPESLQEARRYDRNALLSRFVAQNEPRPRYVGSQTQQIIEQAVASDRLAALLADVEVGDIYYGRKSVGDGSASASDFAICCSAVKAGWSDGEMWNLIRLGRQQRAQEPQKADRPDYVIGTITAAREASVRPQFVTDNNDFDAMARHILATRFDIDGFPTLRHFKGRFMLWQDGRYRELRPEAFKSTIRQVLSQIWLSHNGNIKPCRPSRHLVDEVVASLCASQHLDDNLDAPFWIGQAANQPDPLYLLSSPAGILDLRRMELMPPDPRYFATVALDYNIDLQAPAPDNWLRFLNQLWPEDPQSIAALQQWFGYVLTQDTSRQQILMLVGPPRSGKSTIAHVLTRLVGAANVAAPSAQDFANEFGLMGLRDKTLAILHDARSIQRGNRQQALGYLLSISGEDPVTINVKFQAPWHGRLRARIMVIANEVPSFDDTTGALAARCVTLETRQSFQGREDRQLLQRLLAEMPGILRWALQGLAELDARISQPESGRGLLASLDAMPSGRLQRFVSECCIADPQAEVAISDLAEAFSRWCGRQVTPQDWGRLAGEAIFPFQLVNRNFGGQRKRCYTGVRLR